MSGSATDRDRPEISEPTSRIPKRMGFPNYWEEEDELDLLESQVPRRTGEVIFGIVCLLFSFIVTVFLMVAFQR